MNAPEVLLLAQNPPSPARHGGARRTAQLAELLEQLPIRVIRVEDIAWDTSFWRRKLTGLLQLWLQRRELPFSRRRILRVEALGRYYRGYGQILARHPGARLLILEAVEIHHPLIHLARRHGLPVVCVPQNVEITPGRLWEPGGWADLRHLVDTLAQAESTFTISREEQWLLRGFGIEAEFLPYHPAREDQAQALAIRQARAAHQPGHHLILGSAIHPPTREGMEELLGWLSGREESRQVVVAGFGAGGLNAPPGIQVIDCAPPAELEALLLRARSIIVHQRRGGGALTRIPEALTMGIPVLANPIAARSWHGTPGVHLYEDLPELLALMRTVLPEPPLPAPPAVAARFLETVRRHTGCR